MSSAPAILIAATSARALAASARRAGYAPLVVDFFADDDTQERAEACVRLPGGPARGFAADPLLAACEHLAERRSPAGFVYGAGFEDRPDVLDAIARRWRLFGNPAALVARLKDPVIFADYCRECAIPHPEILLEAPGARAHWLARRRGGSGGGHIRFACEAPAGDAQIYYQRRVAGRAVSALVLADDARGSVLGFSEQWAAPQEGRPFRFAGAARPAALAEDIAERLVSAVGEFCKKAPLVGLNSFDFLVGDAGLWLLEVNPRPGATLDIFETASQPEPSLFALHVAACAGSSPGLPSYSGACAMEIVYADCDIANTPALVWPAWARDRQAAGSFVGQDDPFCSVVAEGENLEGARRRLVDRAAFIRASLCARAA
jgi:predicted ATP-grasp superfamily ATP-dependent carboligase